MLEPDDDQGLTPTDRLMLRMYRIQGGAIVAITLAGAFIVPFPYRWLALVVTAIATLCLFLTFFHVSLRTIGWMAIVLGLAASAFATFGSPTARAGLFGSLAKHYPTGELAAIGAGVFQ